MALEQGQKDIAKCDKYKKQAQQGQRLAQQKDTDSCVGLQQ